MSHYGPTEGKKENKSIGHGHVKLDQGTTNVFSKMECKVNKGERTITCVGTSGEHKGDKIELSIRSTSLSIV